MWLGQWGASDMKVMCFCQQEIFCRHLQGQKWTDLSECKWQTISWMFPCTHKRRDKRLFGNCLCCPSECQRDKSSSFNKRESIQSWRVCPYTTHFQACILKLLDCIFLTCPSVSSWFLLHALSPPTGSYVKMVYSLSSKRNIKETIYKMAKPIR